MNTPRIVAIFLLLWLSVPGLAAEDPVAEKTRIIDPSAQTSALRFDGYVYLDTEGRPLPIQTDEEIESWLARAEIVKVKPIPSGVTMPRKLLLKGDGFEAYAVFKDIDENRRKFTDIINGRHHFSFDWKDSYQFDIAAYKLDRLLGMDRVPPVVSRDFKSDSGSISIWLGRTINEFERTREWKIDPPDRHRWNQQRLIMQVFDNLVANRDNNLGNQLIDPNWRLWFVDCSRCFGTTKTLYYPLKTISQCERGLWQGLQGLRKEDVRESLAPHLGRAEIDALMTRRDKIVRHFEKLIAERGEATVLYDVDPPSEVAPWVND